MKNYFIVIALALTFVFSVSIIGCGGCLSPKGGTKVNTETSTTTLGQELKDLEEAHQKGIISQKEYESAKKKLINKKTK